MKTTAMPSTASINETLTYNPISGDLFWKERPESHFKTKKAWRRFNSCVAGRVAGHRHMTASGKPHAIVIRGTFDGKDMWLLAHRIIYSIMGVAIPEGMLVDHRDRNPFNNAWSNLRLATHAQNSANKPPQLRTNPEHEGLPKGVTKHGNRFKTQIALGGKKRHVGVYATPELAGEAYMKAASLAVGEFARG